MNLNQLKQEINEINEIKNQIFPLITYFANEIENYIEEYYCKEITKTMNMKEKETIFDKNYETYERTRILLSYEKDIMNSLNSIQQKFSEIFSKCKIKKEELIIANNEIIEELKEEDRKINKENEINQIERFLNDYDNHLIELEKWKVKKENEYKEKLIEQRYLNIKQKISQKEMLQIEGLSEYKFSSINAKCVSLSKILSSFLCLV